MITNSHHCLDLWTNHASGRLRRPATLFVTGGRGFIGSHFVERFLVQGHTVYDVDKLTYAAHRRLPFDGHPRYKLIVADIATLNQLPPHLDFVINFAAESHVDRSIGSSALFVHSNVKGVARLLDLVRATDSPGDGCPLFVQISTDEVLGDQPPEGGFGESAPCAPDPYAASKTAAEAFVRASARTYGLRYIITRSSNNYGARQHPEKLVPCAISRVLAGRKVPVHGDGSHRRNWLHVADNCEAVYAVIDRGAEGSIYQIASDEDFTVRQIVTKIAAYLGQTYDEVVERCPDRPGVDKQYALNCDKLKALGWRQERHFDESLPALVDYYRTCPGTPCVVPGASTPLALASATAS